MANKVGGTKNLITIFLHIRFTFLDTSFIIGVFAKYLKSGMLFNTAKRVKKYLKILARALAVAIKSLQLPFISLDDN